MSNLINDNLIERAYEMLEYWAGTTIAKVIQHDLDRHDLESLRQHVVQAESDASRQEFAENLHTDPAESYADMIEANEVDAYQQEQA